MSKTIALHWDSKNGGVYLHRGEAAWRLCLWCVAITVVNIPFDEILKGYLKQKEGQA